MSSLNEQFTDAEVGFRFSLIEQQAVLEANVARTHAIDEAERREQVCAQREAKAIESAQAFTVIFALGQLASHASIMHEAANYSGVVASVFAMTGFLLGSERRSAKRDLRRLQAEQNDTNAMTPTRLTESQFEAIEEANIASMQPARTTEEELLAFEAAEIAVRQPLPTAPEVGKRENDFFFEAFPNSTELY